MLGFLTETYIELDEITTSTVIYYTLLDEDYNSKVISDREENTPVGKILLTV